MFFCVIFFKYMSLTELPDIQDRMSRELNGYTGEGEASEASGYVFQLLGTELRPFDFVLQRAGRAIMH